MRALRRRDVAIASITTITAGFMLLAGSAAASATGPELLPDLKALEGHNLTVTHGTGVRDLRLSTTVANVGSGALEIYPVPGGNCDGDGNPDNDRTAFQRVYRDGDGNLFFTRLADLDSTNYQVGCMIFHLAHNHWHFEDFASYELKRPDDGTVVAATTKVSFCVVDTTPFDTGLPGFDAAGYYNDCGQDATEGLSVGWSDTYASSLPGQSIDIRGLPDGDYCLVVTGDPSDIVRESNELNNRADMRVTLTGNSVAVSAPDCAAGTSVSGLSQTTVDSPRPLAAKRCKKPKRRKCRKRR